MRSNMCTGLDFNLALRIGKGSRIGIFAIQAFGELLVANRGRRGDQITHIHLR
ncbi:hypothetical protein GCM10010096_22380 [Alcaligenes pakistanensis]|uniref:Uncharacterized protein n=1 Tax=Alcaligenes pakistanensis TaxID=1482717 RepID=A0A8H9M540_9BURK|nr:hypothetical protein GCM10010096_22380 [Alcaligenes pakistanensis]